MSSIRSLRPPCTTGVCSGVTVKSIQVLLLGCSLALSAGAQEALVLKADLIQFDPWAQHTNSRNPAEGVIGVLPDLLDEFERRSGLKTQRTLSPYARVELNLEHGLTDLAIMAWGDERSRFANRGTCLMALEFGVRARKGVSVKKYEDLKAITVSASRGLKIDPRFDNDDMVKKDYVFDYTTGVKKTALLRDSDAVGGHLATINYIIEKLGLSDQFGDSLTLRTTPVSVAFSKKSPNFKDEARIQGVFRAMAQDGTVEKIYRRWLGPQSKELKLDGKVPNCDP